MDNYKALGWIGEGAHGVVLKARCSLTGKIVAVKKIPHRAADNSLPCATLREIKAIQHLEHENVVRLLEVIASSSGVLLVFELLCCNLSTLIHNPERPLSEDHVKCCMRMLLCGLEHCHSMGILHRDLKPTNVLVNSEGILKLADFGLACLDSRDREHSSGVATRALGCVFAEMLNGSPLFRGVRELPDYHKISFSESAGVPWRTLLPDVSKHARDLARAFVCYDPERRALLHSFFWSEPLPCRPCELPVPQEQGPQFDMDVCFGTCSQEASLGW
ncbi:hypothetical protein HPB49_022940 [Dermacentor silvarum]|uniref:Uncharacterized protein n=1 Tax=Dermacentor silvarum TaxID=543639 RepID=A0ACB8CHZ2_DERSI|nr:hypothetical protein HPB49_022940 [Dermacentor silvarum]